MAARTSSNHFRNILERSCGSRARQAGKAREAASFNRFRRRTGVERGDEGNRDAGRRIGDLEAFGSLVRRRMAVDIGKLAQQSTVGGEAVELLMAVRAAQVRGHSRGSGSN
ncbi:hypothetical protein [Mesorhizobium sp. M0768]|uniref:hypothetical protein n=1 Tax=Mesorhizobium sp. M0768 TaxID=2956996 RepID=UPI00333C37A5